MGQRRRLRVRRFPDRRPTPLLPNRAPKIGPRSSGARSSPQLPNPAPTIPIRARSSGAFIQGGVAVAVGEGGEGGEVGEVGTDVHSRLETLTRRISADC